MNSKLLAAQWLAGGGQVAEKAGYKRVPRGTKFVNPKTGKVEHGGQPLPGPEKWTADSGTYDPKTHGASLSGAARYAVAGSQLEHMLKFTGSNIREKRKHLLEEHRVQLRAARHGYEHENTNSQHEDLHRHYEPSPQ